MMTNPTTENNVYKLVEQSATEIATNVASQLNEVAALLEKISPGNYGLLITSLRWHATQTVSGQFLEDYSKWVVTNLNYEYT